jgi:CDP-diacylglycerol--glycerol-3-phosphate 3-phosphatidyltransferase
MIFIFLGHEKLFAFFIWFNLTTDIVDGWLARKLNQQTEIGSVIDGFADLGTYILAITGIFFFKWSDFQPQAWLFYVFLLFFVISRLYSFIKFRISYGYHTYAAKITGYVNGLFFIVLFFAGFYQWFYLLMIISGIVTFSETILITYLLKERRNHLSSLFALLKERKQV